MKLDRNISTDGRGKYALIKIRALDLCRSDKTFEKYTPKIQRALEMLDSVGALDTGQTGTESEFFVIRLKDRYAKAALEAYAESARNSDPEWAEEVRGLAAIAGPDSPWCQEPD